MPSSRVQSLSHGHIHLVSVLIDDRAGSKELVLHPPLNKTGELCRLEAGDAMIVGNGPDGPLLIGVEVKSIFDLISSINTGRLQGTQIPGMLRDYDVSWLLHYGRYRVCPVTGALQILRKNNSWVSHKIGERAVPYGYLEKWLLTANALGIHIKRVITEAEAAAWIGCLDRWWSKPWEKHRGMHSFDNSGDLGLLPTMDPATKLRAKVAAQLPGVGFKRAIDVAKHFGSVSAMIGASIKDWEEIPGVGRVIARAAWEAVR